MEGDQIARLPCKHMFHDPCLLPWLEKVVSSPASTVTKGFYELTWRLIHPQLRASSTSTTRARCAATSCPRTTPSTNASGTHGASRHCRKCAPTATSRTILCLARVRIRVPCTINVLDVLYHISGYDDGHKMCKQLSTRGQPAARQSSISAASRMARACSSASSTSACGTSWCSNLLWWCERTSKAKQRAGISDWCQTSVPGHTWPNGSPRGRSS